MPTKRVKQLVRVVPNRFLTVKFKYSGDNAIITLPKSLLDNIKIKDEAVLTLINNTLQITKNQPCVYLPVLDLNRGGFVEHD